MIYFIIYFFSFFFFNDTATTEIYTLSLHDALPISLGPAYLSGGHSQYPYLLVQLRSCAKRAFGSFAGYLQLLLTATWRRICVEFRSRQRALRTTAATAGGGAGVSS